jgi:S-(hydroxymethyl)glutathione dehydrogenase/alcohol dehydrogenase
LRHSSVGFVRREWPRVLVVAALKAAVLVKQNAPLEICDVEIPSLGVGQVLVQMAYAGLCGKQIDEISGRQGFDRHLPHLLGHEGSGIVEDTGPGVRKVHPGDHVVLHWMKGSGIESDPPRFRQHGLGLEISAGWVTTFSKYTIASENRVTKVPDDAPLDACALLGCAATTGLGIVFRQAKLMPGQSIAVFGCGGIGLSVVMAAKLVNAFPIWAVDKSRQKLDLACKLGATHVTKTPAVPAGCDLCVDTTGVVEIREGAYSATAKAGMTILAGVPSLGDRMTLDSFPLHFGRRLVGSHGGDTVPDVDIPRYYELYRRGILPLDQLITDRVPLAGLNGALEAMRCGDILGRCLIDMGANHDPELSRRVPRQQ